MPEFRSSSRVSIRRLPLEALVGDPYRLQKSGSIYTAQRILKETSVRKAPYVTAKHGMSRLCRVVAKEGAGCNVRASVVCPGFVRTPLVDQQISEQTKELDINEDNIVKHLMLKDTVDGESTTTRDPRGLRRPSRTRRPGCLGPLNARGPLPHSEKPAGAGLAELLPCRAADGICAVCCRQTP
jgi:NAD(P)-dependent dehydrogenase (short-subunit alcohol dehydrogenase family)